MRGTMVRYCHHDYYCYFLLVSFRAKLGKFTGAGYTGTLVTGGVAVAEKDVEPGDVVIYGNGHGHHAALIVSVSKQGGILTISHGKQGAVK